MEPDKIKLNSLNKIFEYEKLSREIDNNKNIESIKNLCKCFFKLYLKQQETLLSIGLDSIKENKYE